MADKIHSVAVVGLITMESQFLVIQRSATVRAPHKWCFPGGSVEQNESFEGALRRELDEELGLIVTPIREVWTSVTPWQTEIRWWLATAQNLHAIRPEPAEVADVGWLTLAELRRHPELLESNIHFLDLVESGEINLDGAWDGTG